MGIIDENQNEIIRLGTVHSAVFKISLYVMPLILGYFGTMVLRHDKEIAVMQQNLTDIRSTAHGISTKMGMLPNKVAAAVRQGNEDE